MKTSEQLAEELSTILSGARALAKEVNGLREELARKDTAAAIAGDIIKEQGERIAALEHELEVSHQAHKTTAGMLMSTVSKAIGQLPLCQECRNLCDQPNDVLCVRCYGRTFTVVDARTEP